MMIIINWIWFAFCVRVLRHDGLPVRRVGRLGVDYSLLAVSFRSSSCRALGLPWWEAAIQLLYGCRESNPAHSACAVTRQERIKSQQPEADARLSENQGHERSSRGMPARESYKRTHRDPLFGPSGAWLSQCAGWRPMLSPLVHTACVLNIHLVISPCLLLCVRVYIQTAPFISTSGMMLTGRWTYMVNM